MAATVPDASMADTAPLPAAPQSVAGLGVASPSPSPSPSPSTSASGSGPESPAQPSDECKSGKRKCGRPDSIESAGDGRSIEAPGAPALLVLPTRQLKWAQPGAGLLPMYVSVHGCGGGDGFVSLTSAGDLLISRLHWRSGHEPLVSVYGSYVAITDVDAIAAKLRAAAPAQPTSAPEEPLPAPPPRPRFEPLGRSEVLKSQSLNVAIADEQQASADMGVGFEKWG